MCVKCQALFEHSGVDNTAGDGTHIGARTLPGGDELPIRKGLDSAATVP
jgi:hypothetical protein